MLEQIFALEQEKWLRVFERDFGTDLTTRAQNSEICKMETRCRSQIGGAKIPPLVPSNHAIYAVRGQALLPIKRCRNEVRE